MKLSPKTKVDELLTRYPFLKDALIRLDPHFKALDNPLLRKTLGKVATLSKVAMVGGIELNKLLNAMAQEIKKQTGEELPVEGEEKPAVITDPEQRIVALKEIIEDLHKGIDIKVLKRRFLELIRDVAPSEIASMEQRLISEGMPEAEVKRLCDVHVEVFKESLENKVVPGLPAGHPVHTYMIENRRAETIIGQMQAVHDIKKDKEQLAGFLETLSAINLHYLRKENQLFPILEAHGISGPSKVMWALHDDIRQMLKEVTARVREGVSTPKELQALIQMMNDMIYKEEHILFPMALETLGDSDWAKVRDGEEEIGYAWVQPAEGWKPSGETYQENIPQEKVGSLTLDTGLLTAEQINLLLTHLPVDISFVDENDKVAYYSQTEDRIFPRSPGIIGRSVQNCHPSKSVHVVDKILQEFKSGNRDSAEFWIQMKGRFINIRYFAVRDHKGKYRGTLEVSQDVTSIRGLEGDKRLLDWN
ncbi:MAG: hypothetical protein H6Q94_287 [Nitrospirae bacterium]|nr:hypothetical protein [Nitrospirota bacterium]